jgi:hypothetical protein
VGRHPGQTLAHLSRAIPLEAGLLPGLSFPFLPALPTPPSVETEERQAGAAP